MQTQTEGRISFSETPAAQWTFHIFAANVTDDELRRLENFEGTFNMWLVSDELTDASSHSLATMTGMKALKLTGKGIDDEFVETFCANGTIESIDLSFIRGTAESLRCCSSSGITRVRCQFSQLQGLSKDEFAQVTAVFKELEVVIPYEVDLTADLVTTINSSAASKTVVFPMGRYSEIESLPFRNGVTVKSRYID